MIVKVGEKVKPKPWPGTSKLLKLKTKKVDDPGQGASIFEVDITATSSRDTDLASVASVECLFMNLH